MCMCWTEQLPTGQVLPDFQHVKDTTTTGFLEGLTFYAIHQVFEITEELCH